MPRGVRDDASRREYRRRWRPNVVAAALTAVRKPRHDELRVGVRGKALSVAKPRWRVGSAMIWSASRALLLGTFWVNGMS